MNKELLQKIIRFIIKESISSESLDDIQGNAKEGNFLKIRFLDRTKKENMLSGEIENIEQDQYEDITIYLTNVNIQRAAGPVAPKAKLDIYFDDPDNLVNLYHLDPSHRFPPMKLAGSIDILSIEMNGNLFEISASQKQAEMKAIDANVAALKEKIKAAQEQIRLNQQKKSLKMNEPITREKVTEITKREIKKMIKEIIKEDRLESNDVNYEQKKDKLIAYVKGHKASEITKFIQRIKETDASANELAEKKRILNDALNVQKSKKEELNNNIRDMIESFFDVADQVQTLTIDVLGSALTLAKKTEANEPHTDIITNINYKKAWNMLSELMGNENSGLKTKMDELIAECTETIEKEVLGAKRNLITKLKDENVIKENWLTDKFKVFISKFSRWINNFKNAQVRVDKFINII